jgi:prepilin-type N-terminal cleavage/methylation domain-containing protein
MQIFILSKSKAPSVARSGFTLIEVLMGAVVMGVAFASMFGILTIGLFISQSSRENLRATQIMLDKMEGVRLYNSSQITNTQVLVRSFTNWFFETNAIGLANAQGYGAQYTGSITLAPVPFVASYTTNMLLVTVNIGWVSAGQSQNSHTRSMATFYSNHGLENYVYSSQ